VRGCGIDDDVEANRDAARIRGLVAAHVPADGREEAAKRRFLAELDRLALPFDTATPSDAELRIAQAQLVGWLEGLFHGIQATLFAQQLAARSQLEDMRQRSLGPGGGGQEPPPRPGSYL